MLRITDISIFAAAFFANGDLRIVLLCIFAVDELFRFYALRELQKTASTTKFHTDLRTHLKASLNALEHTLHSERIYGYVMLPLSGPLGFLVFRIFTD